MTNSEKIKNLAVTTDRNPVKELEARRLNRQRLKESGRIAILVLDKLDELNWSQKILAEKLSVSPQYVNKIIKGQENLTLDTIIKLENILDIVVLNSTSTEKLQKLSAGQVYELMLELHSAEDFEDYKYQTAAFTISHKMQA